MTDNYQMPQYLDPEYLRQWIHHPPRILTETLDLRPVRGLAALLDLEWQASIGDDLPPLWHWVYFNEMPRASEISVDGHASRGGFMPPVPLARRMWAGSSIEFRAPLRIGETVEKRSCIEQVDCKQGKSGPLVLVEVSHQYTVAGHLRITEQQTLAFTNAQRQTNTVPPAKDLARPYDWQRCIAVDPVMLFRYSALTFNSHRIHYDRDYAVQDEAYPGLLVQAPLGATLLFELLRAHAPDRVVRSFTFRAVRPLFDRQSFMLRGICEKDGSISLWVADSAGQLAVQANAFVVAA